MRGPAAGAVLAAAALVLAACGRQEEPRSTHPAEARPVAVEVVAVSLGPIQELTEVSGVLTPIAQASVLAGTDGTVSRASGEVGASVRKGQELFAIERRAPSSRAAGGGGTRRIIRSPLDGVILERRAARGDVVSAHPPTLLATVADIDLLLCRAALGPGVTGALAAGQEAMVTSETLPGRSFAGRVTYVSPAGGPAEAEVMVENLEHALRPGMPVRVAVITRSRPRTMLLPAAAVRGDLLLVVRDGTARSHRVTIGVRAQDRVEILAGVAAGDLVVVPGADPPRDGARVSYRPP